MRLTLRTLLAYLDDILEPAQAKEIGQKIEESSYATDLAQRIREVMRKRRLSAPALEGPEKGIDPNLVAEYLDNALSAEMVTELERRCLSSDLHLAEVAASHQILVIALGEPVEVSEASRKRFHALGPRADRPTDSVRSSPVAGSTRGEEAEAIDSPVAPAASFEASVPDYLKRQPLWKRGLPFVAVTAVLSVWAGLVLTDATIFDQPAEEPSPNLIADQSDVSAPDESSSGTTAVPPLTGSEQSSSDLTSSTSDQSEKSENTLESTGNTNQVASGTDINPQPPAEEPGTGLGSVTPPTTVRPNGVAANSSTKEPATATTDPVESRDDNETPVTSPAPEQPTKLASETNPLRYTSVEGVVLKLDVQRSQWLILNRDGEIHPGELIAVPAPFGAQLTLPNSPVEIRLDSGTLLRYLGPTNASPQSFELVQGRMRLRGPGTDSAQGVFGLSAPDGLWRVELLTPDTDMAIEIARLAASSPNAVLGPAGYQGRIYVLSGSIRLADGQTVTAINTQQSWDISPENRRLAADDSNDRTIPTPEAIRVLPGWLDPVAAAPSSIEMRYRRLFEQEFLPEIPVRETLPPLIRSPDHRIAELAVECLALVRDIPSLIQALQQDDPDAEEMREAASTGLRCWLPEQDAHDEILKSELARRFPADEANILYRLLWGFGEDDARDYTRSQKLLGWLEHGRIAIRELTRDQIEAVTGRRIDFRTNGSLRQRESSMKRLQKQLERDQGLLPPLQPVPENPESL